MKKIVFFVFCLVLIGPGCANMAQNDAAIAAHKTGDAISAVNRGKAASRKNLEGAVYFGQDPQEAAEEHALDRAILNAAIKELGKAYGIE